VLLIENYMGTSTMGVEDAQLLEWVIMGIDVEVLFHMGFLMINLMS
jgi:hypothetical protein